MAKNPSSGDLKGRRRPTQLDVARLAGVSPAVVSAVFNNNTNISIRAGRETILRVQDAVRQLGYVPNPVARSLAKQERRIVGVFTFEQVFPSDRDNFFYPFLYGIERGVEEIGYDLLLFTSATTSDGPRKIYRDGANRLGVADGAILFGRAPDKTEIARLMDDGYRFVVMGRLESPGRPVHFVAAGSTEGTATIVLHLHSLGHRSIAYVGVQKNREQEIDRENGYWPVLGALGLPQRPELFRRLSPAETPIEWLDFLIGEGVTALVAETLELAIRVELALSERGLVVPRDMSVAVLGTPLRSEAGQDRWTCFSIPREEMGRRAVDILVRVLARDYDGSPIQETLPCTFRSGGTVAAPKRQ